MDIKINWNYFRGDFVAEIALYLYLAVNHDFTVAFMLFGE